MMILKMSDLPEGYFYPGDIMAYRHIVRLLPDMSYMCELGTWRGRSLCSLADVLVEKSMKAVGIDTFMGTPSEVENGDYKEVHTQDVLKLFTDDLDRLGIRDRVQVIKGDTVSSATQFADNTFDLIFVDADHSYKCCKADITTWLPKLKKGGIIAGHDYVRGKDVVTVVKEVLGKVNKFAESAVWWKVMP